MSIRSTPPIPSTPTYPEIAANAALVLIAVACSLLNRQLAAQAEAFEQEGGFTERLHRVRSSPASAADQRQPCKDPEADCKWYKPGG